MRSKMPSVKEIRDYWIDPAKWLAHGIDRDLLAIFQGCFACGWAGSTRCHILAHHKGGTETVDNLHILCPVCHEQSENLDGLAYWRWIKQVDPDQVIDQIMIREGVSKSKLYSID